MEFARAAKELGFEWLAEQHPIEEELEALDGLEGVEDLQEESGTVDEDGTTPNRVYLTMPTHAALRKLLGYWREYSNDQPHQGRRAWWTLFGYLNDVRVWSAKDRIDPSLKAYVAQAIEKDPTRPIRIEFDLWFRENKRKRAESYEKIAALVAAAHGDILDTVQIEEIHYHGILAQVPAAVASAIAELQGPLAVAEMVMSIRPQSLYETEPQQAEPIPAPKRPVPPVVDQRQPIAALLDGYPVQAHELLENRIDIDEIDVTGLDAPARRRVHGTAMASLILHGDLTRDENSLTRTLKVIPILAAPQDTSIETTPVNKLPIGMVYRAITAMKVGLNGGTALAPNVVIVNHSVCAIDRPFARQPSAWARLIDFMSHKYNILFIISAGNIKNAFSLRAYADRLSFLADTTVARQANILLGMEKAKGVRGILSPAEAINALTVGATHADGAASCPAGHVDPFPIVEMTNLCSAVGLGINRAIKPDFVTEGGRQVAVATDTPEGLKVRGHQIVQLGQLAAAPDHHGGSLSHTQKSTGTSNATALATRAGIFIADAVEEIFSSDNEDWLQRPTRAVILKTLMTHGCSWDSIGRVLEQAYPPSDTKQWFRRRETIARFLGFGKANFQRVISGNSNRVTLLGDDLISPGELHEYRFPIPSSLLRRRDLRRITLTLSWSTPIKPTTASYRGVALDIVDKEGKSSFWKGVKAALQPPSLASKRGTLQHMVLEGANATKAFDAAGMFIGVQARAVHKDFEGEKVPYALAATLEVAQSLNIDIYNQIKQEIQERNRSRIRGQIRITSR